MTMGQESEALSALKCLKYYQLAYLISRIRMSAQNGVIDSLGSGSWSLRIRLFTS